MAKDDFFVLMYKVLQHLYTCLKEDREVNWSELQPQTRSFPIGEKYWEFLWTTMIEEGFITGVVSLPIVGSDRNEIRISKRLRITLKGIEYLQDNSMMKKAKDAIKTAADLVPRFGGLV